MYFISIHFSCTLSIYSSVSAASLVVAGVMDTNAVPFLASVHVNKFLN